MPREDRLEDVEGTEAMLGANRRDRPPDRAAFTDVVDRRARQGPGSRPGLLVQREDVHVMDTRQALDQREKNRNHAVLSAAIDTAGKDQRDLHAVTRASTSCRYAAAHCWPSAPNDSVASK